MHFIEKFKDGDRISDVYLCKSKSTALTKSGKEYENVMLQDKTGQMDSKIWDPSSGGICDFDAMDYVAVTGQVISFNGALQLKIERIRKADEGEYVPSDYIPCSKYDIEEMYTELMQYIGSVKNEYLSALLKSFFTDDADNQTVCKDCGKLSVFKPRFTDYMCGASRCRKSKGTRTVPKERLYGRG